MGGILNVEADPAPTLGGLLDAADHDILNIHELTLGGVIFNDESAVVELSALKRPTSEGVRLEGAMGKLTLDMSGALLERVDYLGLPQATLSLQDSVRLQGPGEVFITGGGAIMLSGEGGSGYVHVGSEIHVIGSGAVKLTGVNSALVEILSHYNGSTPAAVAIGIQAEGDALVAQLTFDSDGNATFDSAQGGLIPPRYATGDLTTILAAHAPPAGFFVFNTTLGVLQYYNGTTLKTIATL